MPSLNLELRKFYDNKKGETFIVAEIINPDDFGYVEGFRFWIVQIGDRNNQAMVTSNGMTDVICLDVQDTDLVREVIYQ